MEEEKDLGERLVAVADQVISLGGGRARPAAYFPNPDYLVKTLKFIEEVGEVTAKEAYFGGWIGWEDDDKPEDTLIIGKKNVKAWDNFRKREKKAKRNTESGNGRGVKIGIQTEVVAAATRARRANAERFLPRADVSL